MTPQQLKSLHTKLIAWYQLKARPLPWRELWRIHQNPWHIWVSEIMLQQTVIKAVLPVYDRFLKQFPTPASLAAADSETVRMAVRGLGYYRRFDFLHRASKHLVHDLKSRWPTSYDEWKAMPGIGDYTASAISSITLDAPHGVVDGNVERVMCRLMDIRTAPNLPALKQKFKVMMDHMAQMGSAGAFNQAVMELGQTVCTPSSPACNACPVSKLCLAFKHDSQSLAPAAKQRTEFKEIQLALLVPLDQSNIALLRRPTSARFLKNALGFPTCIKKDDGVWHGDGFDAPAWMTEAIRRQFEAGTVHSVRHSITHHKITANIIVVKLPKTPKLLFDPISPHMLDERLVSNLDRKVWVRHQKNSDRSSSL